MTQGAVKTTGKRSRAVSAKKKAILSAALDTFSQFGFHGTRLEQIAELAGVSKTNLLYYFPSKEALYIAVLRQILDIWLAPLKAFREDFAPLAAIKEYIRLKLEVSRDYPQASGGGNTGQRFRDLFRQDGHADPESHDTGESLPRRRCRHGESVVHPRL